MAKVGVISTTTDVSTAGAGTIILNGARAPLGTDGAVGNYWHDTAGKALWGPKTAGNTWQKVLQSAP
jgi:hypothetical protein